jgi:hypothetical protein
MGECGRAAPVRYLEMKQVIEEIADQKRRKQSPFAGAKGQSGADRGCAGKRVQ